MLYDKSVIKFLPVVFLIAAVLGVYVYFNFFRQSSVPNIVPAITEEQDTSSFEKRIKTLEGAVLQLADKTGNSAVSESVSSSSPLPSTNIESRLNTLEVSIADIQARVRKLEGGIATPVTTTTPTKSAPAYILSLGFGDSTTSRDWVVANNIDITVDPASYPGYTSMQLEAQVKVVSGNGKVFTRLYDSTAGTSVLSSEVSTAAENPSWVSSQTFTLDNSKKTYKFQIKSLTGYEASIQAARIRVNF